MMLSKCPEVTVSEKLSAHICKSNLRGLVDLKLHISVLRIPSLILRIVNLTADAAGSLATCLPLALAPPAAFAAHATP